MPQAPGRTLEAKATSKSTGTPSQAVTWKKCA
jgi:hypothetical protein